MWRHVVIFAEKQYILQNVTHGILKQIDLDSPTAIVSINDQTEERVQFTWQQRTPHLIECVHHGTAFRIECNIYNKSVVNMVLAINEDAFLEEMQSCLNGEVHLVGLLMDIWREARIPLTLTSTFTTCDDASFNNNHWNSEYPLYEHQKQSIAWMRQRELHDSLFKYYGNIALSETGWFVDTENQCLTQEPSWREAHCRGGILADGTGTGKTATVLYHIVSHSNIVVPSSSLGSKATLIIVPVNLVTQWKDEIRKFCSEVSLVVLVQAKDLKGVTIKHLLDSDIVLTTFHFMRSCKPYSDMVEAALEQRGLGRTRTRAAYAAWSRIPNYKDPILEAVYWRRIVIDEIHTVFESQRELRHLKQLTARYCWGVSATPDLYSEDAQRLYWLLLREKAHHPNMLHVLLKESIRCSHSYSDHPTPDLKLVQLTAEERLHLQSQPSDISSVEFVQLCNFVQVSDTVQSCSVQSLTQEFRESRKKNVELLEAELRQHDNSITILENAAFELDEKLNSLTEIDDCESVRVQIGVAHDTSEQHAKDLAKFRESRRKVHNKLERAKGSMEFVSNRLWCLEKRNQTCPICLDEVCSSILPCGHLFCSSCIRKHLRADKYCPECRNMVTLDDVCGVTLGGIGSKVVEIVDLIRSIDDPIIMFVQWKSMMRGMKAILKGNYISVLHLEGTVSHRATVLEEFKTGGVLLLCLEDSFAGLHLPHAKVVIFSHAIVGDCTSVARLEEQAIARCVRQGQTEKVRVFSFIVSECHEEEIWRQTHPQVHREVATPNGE